MRIRLAAIVVLGSALAACGGGGSASESKTFSDKDFGITFEYPGNFKVTKNVKFGATAGSASKSERAVALDSDNGIFVSKFALNLAITKANVANVKPELDGVIAKIAGMQVDGKPIRAAGLPGFEYTFAVSDPENGRSRISILFDARTEYTLNCQSTPDKRAEVGQACTRALATLRRK